MKMGGICLTHFFWLTSCKASKIRSSREEVKNAIDKLPSGKSPGLDGFPVEFYKEYWEKSITES